MAFAIKLVKTSDQSVLINNNSTACNTQTGTKGYQDFTSTIVNLEPGQQYTITVKTGFSAQDDLDSSSVLKFTQRPIIFYCSIY
jgi:hypothetical protein